MDVIHANSRLEDLSTVTNFQKLDVQTRNDGQAANNTFELVMPIRAWEQDPIQIGDFLYIDQTEFGGLVKSIQKNTRSRTMTIKGLTWRGLLSCKVIFPPSGESHLVFSNVTPSAMLSGVLGNFFSDVYVVDSVLGLPNVSYSFRYQTVLAGITTVFSRNNLSLDVAFDATRGKCVLRPRGIVDYSNDYDISEDLGVNLTIKTGDTITYNHVIGLGTGELTERQTVERWLYNGQIYSSRPAQIPENREQTMVYDYSSVESYETLVEETEKQLQAYADTTKVDVDVSQVVDVDMKLDDTITVFDRTMCINAVKRVSQMVLTITGQYERIVTGVS